MSVDITALKSIKTELAKYNAKLVAVSKTKPAADILEVFNAGHNSFGENYTGEMEKKHESLSSGIEWHFIGHLQSNKVKQIISFVHLIHGVDSKKLLNEINKQAMKINRVVDVLLQVHIAREETKFGFSENECTELIKKYNPEIFPNIRIRGLMGMATFTDNESQVREEYRGLKQLFDLIKKNISSALAEEFDTLSMGMSSDYKIALEEGSTMIRVGSMIFGER